jgi:peptide/nickel transport system permease protein
MTCRSLHRKPLGIPGLWPEVPISRIICLKRRSDSIFCCKSKPYRLLIKERRVSDTAAPAVSQEAKPKQAKKNHLSGGFFRFVLTRFLLIIPTVFILVTVVFFVMRATGDPISAALGGRLTPDELQKRVHAAGYDRPLIVQYIDYLGGLLHGDLGTTLTDNQPVISILVHYGSATFELALLSLIVALIVGIGLGRVAACRRDHAADAGIRTFAILCYATPVFFLGLVLKLIFAIWLNVLPASGRCSLSSEMQFTRLVSPTGFYIIDALQLGDMSVLTDVLRHAVLPALALGLLTAGVFIRLVRTNVISTYNSGYVEAARSRGVSEKRLISKHAWRPALIPIITVMGMQIALMLAGAVLTETTFEWKGLGFMLSQYLKARDFVAVQGIVILIAIIVAVVNFIVDVIAALVDPRVRY